MTTISLAKIQQQVSARKAMLGMLDTPAEVEALRNKGGNRTPEKRELLRRVEKRARGAGLKPVTAYY
jgi:type II secretory pathway component PulM